MSDTPTTASAMDQQAIVEDRPKPDWLVAEPWTDVNLGPVKSGKEAQIDLVERTGSDGRSCLLALKRYAPRKVTAKGQLEEAGFERASTFRHDVEYREGRQFHGDLSAYNLLWWEDRVWFIDLPQAVDLAANPQGLNYLHRDVVNICGWLRRRGGEIDAEELFAEFVATAYG